mmetsp:Transcript_19386/g.47901  ORF Transcript_19386/g.47901 Transcript_19386/m.47901 type:complete len:128 (-) Transcript_19386:16-399(-)
MGSGESVTSEIVEKPLSKPRSLKPKDLTKLAKQVTKHLANKEKSDELVRFLKDSLGDVGRARWLSEKYWDPIHARYTFSYDGIQSLIGKDFERPHEITNTRLSKLAQQLKKLLKNYGEWRVGHFRNS